MYSNNNVFFYIKACQHILLHQIHKIIFFKNASYDPFKLVTEHIFCAMEQSYRVFVKGIRVILRLAYQNT